MHKNTEHGDNLVAIRGRIIDTDEVTRIWNNIIGWGCGIGIALVLGAIAYVITT